MQKPGVFIASSSEGLGIAEAVFACLNRDTRPTLWTNQIFLPGQFPLESLEKQLRLHSFAVIVASPDDQIIKKEITSLAMRDNLLLEFGLFTGVLGRKHTFFVCPSTPQIALPSDLFGIITAIYDAERVSSGIDNISAAVQVACQQIRSVIEEEWVAMQKSVEDNNARLRGSEKGQAIQRLHSVSMQLRDALMAVQRDAVAAFSDKEAFKEVKKRTASRIREIGESYTNDARIIGAEDKLTALSKATSEALLDLPFPHELGLGAEASKQLFDIGADALNTLFQGKDPVDRLRDVASDKARTRMEGLRKRYSEWWGRHSEPLQSATTNMQDALFNAAMNLSSNVRT